MNISKIFIERPVMTVLIMISITFLGVIAYKALPISDLPCVEYPIIQVEASYSGANPETMATIVTLPLERQFTSIDGIQAISSSSKYGQSNIVLQFDISKDINVAATDVQTAINQAQRYLPSDLPYPTYKKVNPTQMPIIYFALSSDLISTAELYNYGYSLIGRRLKMVEGISDVAVYGSPMAIRVQVDPDYLAAHHIGINEVATAISKNNPLLPTGNLYGSKIEYNIDVNGQMSQVEEYNELIIRSNKRIPLKIKDLGGAHRSLQNDKYSLQFFSKNSNKSSAIIAVSKQPKANTLQVVNGTKSLLEEMKWELPSSIEVHTLFDQSHWIVESIHDMRYTLIIAFLLVVLVVLFYLGKVRDTIIPVLAIPLSVIGTFTCLYLFGFNIDMLSLLAITLSIGFLIDDAIVVLENIIRHFETGKSRREAALDGSKQISFTVLAMTLSLASVFIPMIFMKGILGNMFREFTITIFTAILISGFVSLSLIPMLCSRFLSHHNRSQEKWIERVAHKLNTVLLNLYKKGLKIVLKHRVTTLIVGIASLGGTIYVTLLLPTDFIPSEDIGFIQGFALGPDHTSPYKMIEYQHQLSEIIQNNLNVQELVSIGALPSNNQAMFFIRLKPLKERKSMSKTIRELLNELEKVPGVLLFLRPVPLLDLNIGTQVGMGSYQYILQGLNRPALYESANKTLHAMRSAREFTQVSSNMHNNASYVTIDIDRNRASDLNISAQSIEEALQYAYSGKKLFSINGANDQYDVILETIPSAYKDPNMLNKLYVSTNIIEGGRVYPKQVPLSTITSWKQITGPTSIAHINTLPSVSIFYDLADGVPLSSAISKLEEIHSSTLSSNVHALQVGSAQIFKRSFRNLFLLFMITIFAIYVILGILYENFIHPITVMSALPPAMFGGVIALILCREPLSLYAFVGMIMLLGIVLKNGILLVDFANEGIKKGQDLYQAIYEACTIRFRPILMTTLAAMMGALSIALGIGGSSAQSHRPLGLVIVGGLIISQILTLYFTPIIFIYLEKLRRTITSK